MRTAITASIGRRSGFWAIGSRSLPRWLHPGAWWAWALGLAIAASRTTNPWLLLCIVATCAVVVQARKPEAPWARSFRYFLILAAVIVSVRVVFQVVLGTAVGNTLVFSLPGIGLPTWMAGLTLGGPVYVESLLAGLYDGMRLATLIVCIGAANSLASPTRLLKSVPAALYEVGVAIVVAMSFTPRLIESVVAVRSSRRLRGRSERGPRAIASAAVPVLHSALEDSVTLAAAMDSRGYGRRGSVAPVLRRLASASVLVGLVLVTIGTYGLLAPGTPAPIALSLMVVGVAGSVAGLVIAGRSSIRTVYRPDPWWAPEWWAAGTGVVVAATFFWLNAMSASVMMPSTMPLVMPTVPLAALAALLLAATPALVAPKPPLSAPDKVRVEVAA